MDITFSRGDINKVRDKVSELRQDPRTHGLSEKALLSLATRRAFGQKEPVYETKPASKRRPKVRSVEEVKEQATGGMFGPGHPHEFNDIDGSGLIGDLAKGVANKASKVLAWIAPKDMSSSVKRVMSQHANKEITGIKVCRVPIVGVIEKILRLVASVPKQYDKIYHLYMLLTLSDGTVLRAERNQTFQLQPASQKDIDMKVSGEIPSEVKGPASVNVSVPKGITLGKAMSAFVVDANKRNPKFGPWRYAAMSSEGAESNNCQDFVLSFLRGIKALTSEVEKFVKQDIDKLLPEVGTKVQQGITDLAGAVGQHILGKGPPDAATDFNRRIREGRLHVISDFHA